MTVTCCERAHSHFVVCLALHRLACSLPTCCFTIMGLRLQCESTAVCSVHACNKLALKVNHVISETNTCCFAVQTCVDMCITVNSTSTISNGPADWPTRSFHEMAVGTANQPIVSSHGYMYELSPCMDSISFQCHTPYFLTVVPYCCNSARSTLTSVLCFAGHPAQYPSTLLCLVLYVCPPFSPPLSTSLH